MLFSLLGCIVMGLAKALKWTIPKLIRVTAVTLYVVADGGNSDTALQPAHPTKRLYRQLMLTGLAPPGCGVPSSPRPVLIITYRHISKTQKGDHLAALLFSHSFGHSLRTGSESHRLLAWIRTRPGENINPLGASDAPVISNGEALFAFPRFER
jgi:hypothetical protein